MSDIVTSHDFTAHQAPARAVDRLPEHAIPGGSSIPRPLQSSVARPTITPAPAPAAQPRTGMQAPTSAGQPQASTPMSLVQRVPAVPPARPDPASHSGPAIARPDQGVHPYSQPTQPRVVAPVPPQTHTVQSPPAGAQTAMAQAAPVVPARPKNAPPRPAVRPAARAVGRVPVQAGPVNARAMPQALAAAPAERSPMQSEAPPQVPARQHRLPRLPDGVASSNTLLREGEVSTALLEIDGVLSLLSDAIVAGKVHPLGGNALLTAVRDALDKIRQHTEG